MSHPALQKIEAGLAGAHAALVQGELDRGHSHLAHTLDALAQVTRDGFVPQQERPPVQRDPAAAMQLVWHWLARLKAQGCHVFPYAGTLLGLEREGRLLPDDKDADLAVWLEDFALAGRMLQELGLRRATDVPPFGNVATYVEPDSGCSVDLFGLRRNPVQGRTEGGAWLYGRPPGWQQVLHLPWFDLIAREGAAGPVWWPSEPAALLEAFYGDWRTPQPEWDSQVSNRALQDLNLSWHCWALQSLCQTWLTGDLARTLRLLDKIIQRSGDTRAFAGWREALAPGAG